MNDDDLDDDGQGGGQSGLPTGSAQRTGTPSQIDMDALKKALEPTVTQLVEARFNSAKDKRIDKLEKTAQTFAGQLERFEALRAGGASKDQAMLLMDMQDRLDALSQSGGAQAGVPGSSGAGTSNAQAKVAMTAILNAMGLDANSPEVIAVIQAGGDFESQIGKFTDMAVAKKQPANTNPAQNLPSVGGQSTSQTDLKTAYERERVSIRRGDVMGLTQLQTKYKKLGLTDV